MKLRPYMLVIAAALGALISWYAFPRYKTQTETKTVTEYKTRVVERWRKNPDGTEEGTRTTETSGSQVATKSKKESINNWAASIAVESSFTRLEPVYEAALKRRIVGPVFAGIYANTKSEAGISLELEF